MIEQVSRLAEQVASGVSRRAFVRRLGRGAMATVAAMAGVLSFPGFVAAGPQARSCCGGRRCSKPGPGCKYVGEYCGSLGFGPICYWRCQGDEYISGCN